METVLWTLIAATRTLTVPWRRISPTTDGSMNVRFASAAEDSRNVSEDLVLFDSAAKGWRESQKRCKWQDDPPQVHVHKNIPKKAGAPWGAYFRTWILGKGSTTFASKSGLKHNSFALFYIGVNHAGLHLSSSKIEPISFVGM